MAMECPVRILCHERSHGLPPAEGPRTLSHASHVERCCAAQQICAPMSLMGQSRVLRRCRLNVRFALESGQMADIPVGPSRAKRRREQMQQYACAKLDL